jgi:poly(hydroxyalkanoate) depolymerase family esterase
MLFEGNQWRMRPAHIPSRHSHGGFQAVARRGRVLLAAVCAAVAATAALSPTIGQAAGRHKTHHSRHRTQLSLPGTLPSWPGTLPGLPGTLQALLAALAHWPSMPGLPGLPGGSTGLPGGTPGTPPPPPPPPGGVPGTLTGKLTSGTHTNSAGALDYELYVPSGYKAGTAVPMVVALHGCTETDDVYRQLSGWDRLAEAKKFIVVFPKQSSSRNYQTCWNWFRQSDMKRGSGEPSMIADLTTSIEHSYSVDTHRVFVAGFSAGGAMANVMGATYPDLFAAAGVGSGCEYNGLPCVGQQGPDPMQTGKQAYDAMGSNARVMPAIVFQGDADTTVVPANAPEIVREWQVTDDYADNGSLDGSIPTTPTNTSNAAVSGGRSYTVTTYGDGQRHELIQYWLVHGMNHAWSGGSNTQQYADPSGPNETAAMFAFFSNHPH